MNAPLLSVTFFVLFFPVAICLVRSFGFLRSSLGAILVFLFGSQIWAAVYAVKELTEHSSIDWEDILLFFVTQLLLIGTLWMTVKLLPFFKTRE